MKISTKVKIGITVVWVILWFILMDALSYGPSTLGDATINGETIPWRQLGGDPDIVVNDGRYWYENFGAFLLFMIPMAIMWLWTAFKTDTSDNTIKRRGRMF